MFGLILNGDSLEVLRDERPDNSVDLIYFGPPFSSSIYYGRPYANSDAQALAHERAWTWSAYARRTYEAFVKNALEGTIEKRAANQLEHWFRQWGGCPKLAYLLWIAPRLIEAHRVLRLTGTLCWQCDDAMEHYFRILLEVVFGADNFFAAISRKRFSSHNDGELSISYDRLLFYTKSRVYTWNKDAVRKAYTKKQLKTFRYEEPDGRRFSTQSLSADKLSGGGYSYEWHGKTAEEWHGPGATWKNPLDTMLDLEAKGLIHFAEEGSPPRSKFYLDETKGVILSNVWDDLPYLLTNDEKTGLPGQKPDALLDRIIRLCTNEGDMVLDPFLGSGTTAVVAQRLGRSWIGIDVEDRSICLARGRLDREFGPDSYTERCDWPADLAHARKLAERDWYAFQCWIVRKYFNGIPGPRTGDKGADGKFTLKGIPGAYSRLGIIEVKSGAKSDKRHLTVLGEAVDRHGALVGILVAFEDAINSKMREQASAYGTHKVVIDGEIVEFDKVQIVSVERLFDPTLVYGGAHLPGFIPKPNPDQPHEQAKMRRGIYDILEDSDYSTMFGLDEEGKPCP